MAKKRPLVMTSGQLAEQSLSDATFAGLMSAGFRTYNSYTIHGDGSMTVNAEEVALYHTTDKTGELYLHNLTGGRTDDTLPALTDNATSYIVGKWVTGVASFDVITNVSLITESDMVPFATVVRKGAMLDVIPWIMLGHGMTNKLHARLVKTRRFEKEGTGFEVTESGTRNLTITGGVVWYGGTPISLAEVQTLSDPAVRFYKVAGVWNYDFVSAYDNTNYYNGDNTAVLTDGNYAVNWVYRSVSQASRIYIVLGNGDYTLLQAIQATSPTRAFLPVEVSTNGFEIAKIIVLKGSDTAYSIKDPFANNYNQFLSDHSLMTNMNLGNYHHIPGAGTRGDIIYRGVSGWAFLPAGTSTQLLQTNGLGADPSWTDRPIDGAPVFTTVAGVVGTDGFEQDNILFIVETATFYRYETNGGAYPIDSLYVINTFDGGNTRWLSVGGRYMNGDVNIMSNLYFDNNTNYIDKILNDDSFTDDDSHAIATQNSIKAYVGSLISAIMKIIGDWNANTNTPNIAAVAQTGWSWRVSVAGSTDLDGITDWRIGDIAVKTDSGWMKIDNEDISAVWGNISGTLSNQTDLQDALNAKVDKTGSLTDITTRNHNDLQNRDLAGNHAKLVPLADGTTAIQITKADGITAVINVDTTNGFLGIGMIPKKQFSTLGDSGTYSPIASGTGTISSSGTTLTGIGTSFLNEIPAGTLIYVGSQILEVSSATSDTVAILTTTPNPVLAGNTFTYSRLFFSIAGTSGVVQVKTSSGIAFPWRFLSSYSGTVPTTCRLERDKLGGALTNGDGLWRFAFRGMNSALQMEDRALFSSYLINAADGVESADFVWSLANGTTGTVDDLMRLKGGVGLGVGITPTARINIPAGSATIAPFKFEDSSTRKTTPANGEVEMIAEELTFYNSTYGRTQITNTKWTRLLSSTDFSTTAASTSTITMNSDLTSKLKVGMAIKLKLSGVVYYGICTAIASGLLTIAGAPLTVVGGALTELYYSDRPEMVEQVDITIQGLYATIDTNTLLADNGQYFRWKKQACKIVQMSVINWIEDSGTNKPRINILNSGNPVNTSNSNAGLQVSNSWSDSIVDMNASNYSLARNGSLEVYIQANGTNDDSQNLTVSLTLVME